MKELTGSYDDLSTKIENSIQGLRAAFPALETLITIHDDLDNVRETPEMASLVARPNVLDDEDADF